MGGMADGGGPGRLSVPSLRMYDVVIRVIRASLPVRGHRFCSNQGLPALHRSTAVYRCAIPLLHGQDGRQRRSWATFPFGRFACMTSPSASSVPSLPVRGHRFYSNQGLPALHRSTAVYRFAIPLLHGRDGRQRRSWAAFFVQSLRMYDVFIRVIRALSSCSRAPFLQ